MAQVIRVAQHGRSGEYQTVQAAIDAVPDGNKKRIVIQIMPGVYKQPVYVAKSKNFITLRGLHPENTILTWDNTATRIHHPLDSSVIGKGTFGCGTVIVEGQDFIAEGITFENSAPKGSGQAVAIRVSADRCAFYNCRFLGWQDTVYLYAGKHYISHSYIEGSVDFIFGNATAMLEHCHIHCKSQGFITAQARKSAKEPTGYVFLRCVITGNGEGSYAYLGRPWEPFARVVFAYTWMDGCVKPEGWDNWNHPEREATARFYEYRCSGPGSATSGRCKWTRQLTDEEAEQYLSDRFIDPDPHKSWLTNKISLKAPLSA